MTRPTDAVRTAVRRALASAVPDASRGGFGEPPLALVACSGGPDSLALAAAAGSVAQRAGWRAGAVVVDHGIQQGSAVVSAAAAEQCRVFGLDPVVVVPVAVTGAGGPEAAARRARYAAFAAAARTHGAAMVLLAHSLEDQAETVLLGLARGSGARSLSGMPAVRALPGAAGTVLARPLLGLTRADIAEAGAAWGAVAWQDPQNMDSAFTRSRVRHLLLPALAQALGPGIPQALARTANLLRDDEAALAGIAEDALAALQGDAEGGARGAGPDVPQEQPTVLAAISREGLAEHPAAIRRRVLHRLVLRAGSPASRVTAEHIAALDALGTGGGAAGLVKLPGAVNARVRYGRLELVRRQE